MMIMQVQTVWASALVFRREKPCPRGLLMHACQLASAGWTRVTTSFFPSLQAGSMIHQYSTAQVTWATGSPLQGSSLAGRLQGCTMLPQAHKQLIQAGNRDAALSVVAKLLVEACLQSHMQQVLLLAARDKPKMLG